MPKKSFSIISAIKELLSLPDFMDEEQQNIGRMLTIFFWTVMFFLSLNLLIIAITLPERAFRPVLTILVVNTIFVTLLFLIKRGRFHLTSYLSLGVSWLVVTLFALTAGGTHAPSYIGYIVLIFLAGISLGGKAIFVVAAICGASGLGMAYLESAGLLPASEAQFTPYTYWLVGFSFLLIIASMLYYSGQMIRNSLKRARTELADRIKTEQALHESENRFRALIEQSPVAICVTREQLIVYANPAYRKMFGLDQDLAGFSLLDQIAPQCRDAVAERSKKRDLGLPVDIVYETTGLRADGTTFDLLAQVTRVNLADGLATIAYLTDISKQKAAENALMISEEKFSSAFYNSPILMSISRLADGAIAEVNQAFLNTFEVTRDEIRHHSFVDLGLWGNLDEREYYLDLYRKGEKHLFFTDLHGHTRSHKNILLAGSINIIQVDGEDYALAVLEDITELKRAEHALRESEERFHTLVERAPIAIMISRGTEPIYANRSLLRMIGFQDEAQATGRSIVDYFIPTYPHESRASIARRIIDLPSPGEIEIDMLREDGSRFPAQIFITSIQLSDGEANVSFIIDITERKLAEAQITASVQQLRALSSHLQTVREEERTRIAREIHDELGQALTSLKMDLFWLKNRLEKHETAPGLIVNKLSSMVMETDLLIDDVRRISTDLRPSILDTLGLVAAIEWLARDFQARSGIACQFQTTLSSLSVTPDFSTAVFRICQEALTNVARHARADGVMVQLKLLKDSLILSIEDDGKGITEDDLRRPGSLGILGMKERALSFNGRVDFEPSTRGGTCVTARFPSPVTNGDRQ